MLAASVADVAIACLWCALGAFIVGMMLGDRLARTSN
jgi:hypothetical protein